MTITDGKYVSDARLILNPDTYTAPGTNETDLGLIGSSHIAGFRKDVSLLSNSQRGTIVTEAKVLGINLLYSIILLNRSTEVMELMFENDIAGDVFKHFSAYKPGKLVTGNETSKLLIRPTVATKPHLYIPRAIVIEVGPIHWDRQIMHQEAALLQISALYDSTTGAPYFYGDPDNFPSL